MSYKTRIGIFASVFIGVCALSTFLFWCGGFNFDHRNGDVALGVLLTCLCATCAAFAATPFE